MSHMVIIIKPPGGGGRIAEGASTAESQVSWSPDDSLTPVQVFRRSERAERMLAEVEAMLTRPAGEE